MTLLNENSINSVAEGNEVGGLLACILGCGSLCLLTGGMGTEIMAAAYLL